jgi:5S rRNA maturation endonuclease (ribonuclease M5)
MSDLFNECNDIDSHLIVERFDINRARERNKVSCVHCSSSDAMHVFRGSASKRPGFKCYSCDQSMSNIDAVMMLMGTDKSLDAALEIAARFGIPTDTEPGMRPIYSPPRRDPSPQPIPAPTPTPRASYTSIWRVLELGQEAVNYLHFDRAIHYECAFDMGVRSIESREALHAWLDSIDRADQIALGLLRVEEDGRERTIIWDAPVLVLPYFDYSRGQDDPGRVVGLRFAPFGEYRARYPKLKYLSPFERRPDVPYAAWQIAHAIDAQQPLWIVEGELNALSLQQIGLPAIATAGASAWQTKWLEPMLELRGVILACDGDEAGERWADRVTDDVCSYRGHYAGMRWAHVKSLPPKQDVNDLAQRGELRAWADAILEEMQRTFEQAQ